MNATNLTAQFLVAMPTLDATFFSGALIFVCEHGEDGALGVIVNRPLGISLKDLFEQIRLPSPIASLATQPVMFGGPVRHEQGFVLHRPIGHWRATLHVTDDIGLTSSSDVLSVFGDWNSQVAAEQSRVAMRPGETAAESSAADSALPPGAAAMPPTTDGEPNSTLKPAHSERPLNLAGGGTNTQLALAAEERHDMILLLGYAGWSAGQLESEISDNYWLTVEADPDLIFDIDAAERLDAAVRSLGIDRSQLTTTVGHA